MRFKVKWLLRFIGTFFIGMASLLAFQNIEESNEVGRISANIYQELITTTPVQAATSTEKIMPAINIDGIDYIGHLNIPKLEKKLPVGDQFSFEQLKLSPTLFQGSYFDNSMIICAHNYPTHFAGLDRLAPGDVIEFTNAHNMTFRYQVTNIEILHPSELNRLTQTGDWDLTLFTCTFDTLNRVIIRATLV